LSARSKAIRRRKPPIQQNAIDDPTDATDQISQERRGHVATEFNLLRAARILGAERQFSPDHSMAQGTSGGPAPRMTETIRKTMSGRKESLG
jgi:hypothetical protein